MPFDSIARFESEVRLLRAHDETFRPHLLRAAPIRAAEESTIKWFGTFTDVEDQKRSEEALRQRQKLDSIGLLAVASRTTSIIFWLASWAGPASLWILWRKTIRPVRCSKFVVRSERESGPSDAAVARLCGQGQDVSGARQRSAYCSRYLRAGACSVPKSVQIVDASDADVPVIETNTGQMQQLVMNLVINAAEAIGEETGTVTVRAAREFASGEATANVLGYAIAPGEYVLIEVGDSGPGMDERTQAQIFDPFFTTKFTGRGLGLAAVHGIVRSLNGAIEVRSAPGKGSTFRLLLPARKPHGEATSASALEEKHGDSVILVVDDEEVVRTTARTALERNGHKVLAAAGGAEAFEYIPGKHGTDRADPSGYEHAGDVRERHTDRAAQDLRECPGGDPERIQRRGTFHAV